MLLAHFSLGHYQLLRPISSGGTGTIYLAQDSRTSRQIAVKVVRLDDTSQEKGEIAERLEKLFVREMQSIAQLDHPHILSILDFGQEKTDEVSYAYAAMRYHPAGSLADWLCQERKNERLSLSEIAALLLQVAEALDYAHTRNIIHQAIKPSNFLLSTSCAQSSALPDLVLADFGFAHFFAATSSQGLSQSDYVRGTSPFMAPEQWDGKAVPASDQYALAMMVYSLLTGQFPFQGSLSQLIHQHHVTQLPAPSSFNPQLDPSIDEIMRRALDKEPAKRFPSILAFAQAFAPFQQLSSDQPDSQPDIASNASPNQLASLLPQHQPAQLPPTLPDPALIPDALSAQSPLDETLIAPLLFDVAGESPQVARSIPVDSLAITETDDGKQDESSRSPFVMPPTALAAPTPAYPGAGLSLPSELAPPLPILRSNLPPHLNLSVMSRRNSATTRKGLLIALIALVVLAGCSALLVKSITASAHSSAGKLNSHNSQANGTVPFGQTPANDGGITISGTPAGIQTPGATPVVGLTPGTTPTTSSTPATGQAPQPTATPTPHPQPTSTPTPRSQPTATPTPRPQPTATPKPAPVCPPTIANGNTGSWVSRLQEELNARGITDSNGHKLAVDGQFGPLTVSAVKKWQTREKIEVDGEVGPITWHTLGNC
ncbi:MAG TPA: protein kinase [Ktedonobacteraceae bacterium]|nr:protein kinase [Ktedonobacteraceae bacterium]